MTDSANFKMLAEEMRTGFASVVGAIVVMHSDIREIKVGINGLNASLDGVKTRLDVMNTNIVELQGPVKDTNARAQRLGEVLEGTNCRVDGVGDLCAKIDSKTDRLVDGVNHINARIDSEG